MSLKNAAHPLSFPGTFAIIPALHLANRLFLLIFLRISVVLVPVIEYPCTHNAEKLSPFSPAPTRSRAIHEDSFGVESH